MKKLDKFFLWLPRVLTILFTVFISLFSLDIFEMQLGFWGTMVGLFMHNIPTLFLILIIVLSWRRYLLGAVIFTTLATFYLFSFGGPQPMKFTPTLLAIIIAGCYLLSHRQNFNF